MGTADSRDLGGSHSSSSPVLTGILSDLHPQLEVFRAVPNYRGTRMLRQLLAAGVFLGLILAALPVISLSPKLDHGALGLLIFIPWFCLSAWICLTITKRTGLAGMSSEKEIDLQTLPPARDGDRYVGISYCDGDWAFQGDTSWDRGWISVHDGAVHFRGFGPSFDLPVPLVEEIAIRQTKSIATNSLPRIYVTWHDEDGTRNVFSLEVRDAKTRTATIAETMRLATWLREQVAADSIVGASAASLPFRSSELDFSGTGSTPLINRSDRILAAFSAVGVCIVFFLALVWYHRLTGRKADAMGGLAGIIALGTYNAVVFKRVKSRKQAQH